MNDIDSVDYDSLSREHAILIGDTVYIPVTRTGEFVGWEVFDKKYFTEERLKEIREEMDKST